MEAGPAPHDDLDLRAVIDGFGQGVLIFDAADRLVLDNAAARALLGPQIVAIRAEGWPAAVAFFDASPGARPSLDEVRSQALRQATPVRFHTLLAGAHTPCWASALYGRSGELYLLIVLEQPDWSSLTELLSTFRDEAVMSISSTRGHARLIEQVLENRRQNQTVEDVARRVGGFARIISIHMFRLELLMSALYRLEMIRTGQLVGMIANTRRRIDLNSFLEDLLEDLADQPLLENAERGFDYRDRVRVDVDEGLDVLASRQHLGYALRDVLRNSLMYSPPETPIAIAARRQGRAHWAQIDVKDEGCGIRASESGRVFAPFQRARQPQIIGEFGYGLSLHLVKAEIEAMGGRIGFTSQEGDGATFSLRLPLWSEAASGANPR